MCPVSQSTALQAGLVVVTFSSMVWASPRLCPASAAGLPQFVDRIEGRCSPCTRGVCKTYSSIPKPCVCICVTGYRGRDYTEEQKRLCQPDKPGDSTTPNYYQSVIPSCVIAAIVIPLAVVSYKKWKRKTNIIQEQATLMPNVGDTFDEDIHATDGTGLTAHPPPLSASIPLELPSVASPSIVQVHKINERQPISHRVTSPPREDRTPEQENQNDGHMGTEHKTTRGENLSGIPEVGPRTPEEGVPGHDSRIRKAEG